MTATETVTVNPDETTDAAAWFARQYGREPEGVWFAPGRVNLIGGPDYTEMFVLPFALGHGVSAAAARRPDRRIALASRQAGGEPVVLSIDTLEPGEVSGWAAYPAGVAWALRQAGHLAGGADVAIDADLPAGAGLSSSAALECSVALALTELYGLSLPRHELAALARRAENDFVGVPSGIMDQIAALRCQAGHAALLDCRTGAVAPVPLDPAAAGLTLLVIDTGYPARQHRRPLRRTPPRLRTGRVRAGRPVAAGHQGRRRPSQAAPSRPPARGQARPVRQTPRPAGRRPAGAGDQAAIGPLLTASHRSLRDDYQFSWPQADEAVEAAVEAGAAGARMTAAASPAASSSSSGHVAGPVRSTVTERFTSRHWSPRATWTPSLRRRPPPTLGT